MCRTNIRQHTVETRKRYTAMLAGDIPELKTDMAALDWTLIGHLMKILMTSVSVFDINSGLIFFQKQCQIEIAKQQRMYEFSR